MQEAGLNWITCANKQVKTTSNVRQAFVVNSTSPHLHNQHIRPIRSEESEGSESLSLSVEAVDENSGAGRWDAQVYHQINGRMTCYNPSLTLYTAEDTEQLGQVTTCNTTLHGNSSRTRWEREVCHNHSTRSGSLCLCQKRTALSSWY